MEEVVEVVAGPWGLAALVLVATNGGRRLLRGAFKNVVKAGLVVGDKAKQVSERINEETQDLIAEAESERKTAKETKEPKSSAKKEAKTTA